MLTSDRRAMFKRALVLATLAGGFCISGFMMRANSPTPIVEATRLPPADLDPVATGSISVTSDACRARVTTGRTSGRVERLCLRTQRYAGPMSLKTGSHIRWARHKASWTRVQ